MQRHSGTKKVPCRDTLIKQTILLRGRIVIWLILGLRYGCLSSLLYLPWTIRGKE
ncbi:hypothetical protein BDW71DRAFT_184665 [Aspergillus fruticulosus]